MTRTEFICPSCDNQLLIFTEDGVDITVCPCCGAPVDEIDEKEEEYED